LKLRIDDHAQKEIRDLARKVLDLIRPVVPVTCEAFEDFVLGAVTLSRLEVEALRGNSLVNAPRSVPGKGENAEWEEKLQRLFLSS
jgi:thymidylate synthase (FAD)